MLQFTRTALVALHGDEDGRRVTEIIDERSLQHTGRHLSLLQKRQPRTYLIPRHLIIDIRHAQHHIDIRNAVLGDAEGEFLIHRLEGVDIVLQRYRHLLLHLIGGSTRVERHDESLPDGELRKLILVHPRQGPYTKGHQTNEQRHHDSVMPHGSFYVLTRFQSIQFSVFSFQ